MSRKKATGSTMTLKDFHGGSIPSDLPLPSAPGIVPRSADRPSYDRTSWANTIGRPDQRSRPKSSPSIRHFDDKTPFLSQSPHIGRNFDEDERKPLDGPSAPRRTVYDDSFRGLETRVEHKAHLVSVGRVSDWQRMSPAGGVAKSYSGKVSETAHVGLIPQNAGFSSGGSGTEPYPSAWALRKEVTVGASELLQPAWAGQTTVSKLAHASALEKVSSGRWQSKPHYQSDVEVIQHSEPGSELHSKVYDDKHSHVDVAWAREYSDATLARRVERVLSIEEGVHRERNRSPEYERPLLSINLEANERKVAINADEFQPACSDGKSGGPERQPTLPPDMPGRPKLKLLPRTKPLEPVENPVKDLKQELKPGITLHDQAETGDGMYRNLNPARPGLSGSESVDQPAERPKLNLKARSQPLEQSEGNRERGRNAVFGGARPRELVLKERDDVAINTHELVQHRERIPKTERVSEQPMPSRHGEKVEPTSQDQRTGRKFEKKDNRTEADRVEIQRRNWRNENKRTSKENERKPQVQERHPSPETWRKPVVAAKPASPDGTGLRYGKGASAIELAQVFSRPFSDPKAENRFSAQQGIPSRTQIPFSRLTSSTPRQINGY